MCAPCSPVRERGRDRKRERDRGREKEREKKRDGERVASGNTKRGSIIVPLTSCLTILDKSVLQIKTKIVSCHTADSQPVKQEVNGTVILPPLVFPALSYGQTYAPV